MSVLCCHIPEFLIRLALCQQPALAGSPIALLGPDERVCAASALAYAQGVRISMRPQQAQMRCAEAQLLPVNMRTAQDEQQAFLSALADWALPVEAQHWGTAYVDMHAIAKTSRDVQPLIMDAGRRLRTQLGVDLQPALGWDSGKFTARAAAVRTSPGRLRLIDKAEEVTFLKPLPVTLLPLPPQATQQLQWLGIRTLGQFAQLPPIAVWQRFGRAGKLAQRWAQGRDDRPVRDTVRARPTTLDIMIDPPTGLLLPVLDALMQALQPHLYESGQQLQGINRLRVQLDYVDGALRSLDLATIDPTNDEAYWRQRLTAQLTGFNWGAETSAAQITLLEMGELPIRQLALLPEMVERSAQINEIAETFGSRYGGIFFRGQIDDTCHPVAERRIQLHALP